MPLWKQLLLNLYYGGSYPLRCWNHRCAVVEDRVPIAVLFYHRVADEGANAWTVSNRTFARQVQWLRKNFELVSLAEVQRRLRRGANHRPCVSITFDDGYADNCREAIPLLIKQRIPCTYFVTVRNVLDGVPFPHDVLQATPPPPNSPPPNSPPPNSPLPNSIEQLRAMAAAGIEIGAHSYTHADLGKTTDPEQLHHEVVTAGEDLQRALGRPVHYFAFPFGLRANLNSDVFALAYEAGYQGVCSAYGGFNFPGDDAFHLQRIAVDDNVIGLKNWTTVDPRKVDTLRFVYETEPCSAAAKD